jgi:chromosome partitioning protein
MKTITIGNQKGGVGKSTIAVNLAFYLEDKGYKVLFCDVDGQGNSSSTLEKNRKVNFNSSELFTQPITISSEESICVLKGTDNLSQIDRMDYKQIITQFTNNLKSNSTNFDFCIIDTAPSLNLRLIAALTASDYVLCPIELSEWSLKGIQKMISTISSVKKKYNSGLNFIGMLPNRVNSRSKNHQQALRTLISKYPDHILNAYIVNRAPIADAIDKGVPVWENKSGNAREASKEFITVIERILEKMDVKTEEVA